MVKRARAAEKRLVIKAAWAKWVQAIEERRRKSKLQGLERGMVKKRFHGKEFPIDCGVTDDLDSLAPAHQAESLSQTSGVCYS